MCDCRRVVTGHKTRSMFARYSIVSERDMAEMFERAERVGLPSKSC
jgi:hypothetical protein